MRSPPASAASRRPHGPRGRRRKASDVHGEGRKAVDPAGARTDRTREATAGSDGAAASHAAPATARGFPRRPSRPGDDEPVVPPADGSRLTQPPQAIRPRRSRAVGQAARAEHGSQRPRNASPSSSTSTSCASASPWRSPPWPSAWSSPPSSTASSSTRSCGPCARSRTCRRRLPDHHLQPRRALHGEPQGLGRGRPAARLTDPHLAALGVRRAGLHGHREALLLPRRSGHHAALLGRRRARLLLGPAPRPLLPARLRRGLLQRPEPGERLPDLRGPLRARLRRRLRDARDPRAARPRRASSTTSSCAGTAATPCSSAPWSRPSSHPARTPSRCSPCSSPSSCSTRSRSCSRASSSRRGKDVVHREDAEADDDDDDRRRSRRPDAPHSGTDDRTGAERPRVSVRVD